MNQIIYTYTFISSVYLLSNFCNYWIKSKETKSKLKYIKLIMNNNKIEDEYKIMKINNVINS